MLGPYRVRAEPTAGGLASELHEGDSSEWVIKRYRPSEAARAPKERAALERAGQTSPIVPEVLDAFVDDEGRPCLVLEKLGPDLSALGRRSETEAAEATISACRALIRLHASGLCHGDVRAANLALSAAPERPDALEPGELRTLKLLDFDRAQPYSPAQANKDVRNLTRLCLELLAGAPAHKLGKTDAQMLATFAKSPGLREVLAGALDGQYDGNPAALVSELMPYARPEFQTLAPLPFRKRPATRNADGFDAG